MKWKSPFQEYVNFWRNHVKWAIDKKFIFQALRCSVHHSAYSHVFVLDNICNMFSLFLTKVECDAKSSSNSNSYPKLKTSYMSSLLIKVVVVSIQWPLNNGLKLMKIHSNISKSRYKVILYYWSIHFNTNRARSKGIPI